jgi:hypothetical protein
MNPIRQQLHEQLAQGLGCTDGEDYCRKKAALLTYLRRAHPHQFNVQRSRKRAFEHLARVEGITPEQKAEDLALVGFLIERSFKASTKAEALAALSNSAVPDADRPMRFIRAVPAIAKKRDGMSRTLACAP